jgi:AraC family transcriptional regulator of arabinose operon
MLHAHELLYSHWPHREALAMNAIEGALLWCQPLAAATSQPMDARVEAAIAYIMRHLDQPMRMADVVNAACLSRSRLIELFINEKGMPVMTFIERERMRRAANLLTLTELTVKEIARLVGYDDPSHFSRRFHAVHGRSPLTYRQAKGGM